MVGTIDREFLTIGQLVRMLRQDGLEVTSHQVKYAIQEYAIEPVGRAGIIRVWGPDAIPRIKGALARIASNRGGVL